MLDIFGPGLDRLCIRGPNSYTFQPHGTSCCAKWAVNLQTTLQAKAGRPITVMDDWEQFHTNVTLLKPTKHCHSLIRALQGHEKVVWKSRPGYSYICSYSVVMCCGVWIVHEWSYKVSQSKGFQFLYLYAWFSLAWSHLWVPKHPWHPCFLCPCTN